MKDRIIALYRAGRLTDAGLRNAVLRGWITQDDYDTLTAERGDTD